MLTTACASTADAPAWADSPVVASPVTASPTSVAQTLPALIAADVVYLGEQHDSVADHAAQLAIIEALHAENPNVAIALEMFQRPFQPVLDQYLAGEITEAELIEQTEYEQRWGFPWELYAPIVRFAKANQIPLIALNAPTEVVRQVSRQGLSSLGLSNLAPETLAHIPPIADIDTSNDNYRAFVLQALGAHGAHGNFNPDNFFAAQLVWDETMAERIAQFRQTHPETQVIVLAGQGHVIFGYGIPDRVARRLGDDLSQQIVVLNPSATIAAEEDAADIFWYSD
ncbi:MAG: ChaN family lipoprotein [Leptolyngbya sp. RL_3_1]|nr:ChaN family lipoprotein [Leptolyngbya sp. RL_3_1]